MCECTSKHICPVHVWHMSLTGCQLCAFVCQFWLFPFAAISLTVFEISASFPTSHLAACVALAAGAGVTASGTATPTPPSCSLITAVRQPCLGSSHSISHCCAALPWALAPLCPTHPVETTGPSSLWYLAPCWSVQIGAFYRLSACTECTTVCCRPPPSCLCLCRWSACLCCTRQVVGPSFQRLCFCCCFGLYKSHLSFINTFRPLSVTQKKTSTR